MIITNYFKRYQFEIASFLASFFIALILFNMTNMRFPNDDQFILYRYVDNIISGNGFVFNIGEKILGSTTPLFTILSSIFAYILKGLYIPDVVAYLNIFLMASTSVFIFKILRYLSVDILFSYLGIIIYSLNMSKMIPEGMETPLFLFLIFAAIYFLLNDKKNISTVFLALSLITRPDAIIACGLFLVYWFINYGLKSTIRLCCIFSIVILPWLIFAYFYFGSFIPQSLLAKMQSSDIVRMPYFQAFKVQLASISRIYWGSIIDFERIIIQVIVNLLPILLFIFIFIKNNLNRKNWIIFAIPSMYFILFSISNPIMFPWYVSQTEPFWILMSFWGIYILYKKNQSKYYLFLLLIISVFPFISFANRITNKDIGSKTPLFVTSQYLNNKLQKGDTVGISNIGIVSFETKAYIVDFFGLVRPDSVLYYPIKNGCFSENELYVIPPDLVKDSKPDWLVAGDGEMDPCFLKSKWFNLNYSEDFRIGSLGIYKYTKNGN